VNTKKRAKKGKGNESEIRMQTKHHKKGRYLSLKSGSTATDSAE